MALLSLVLHFLSAHRFLMLLLGPLGLVLLSWLLRLDMRRFWRIWPVMFAGLVLNIFLGPRLNAWFLYHYGHLARAVVTGLEGTRTRYNNRPVLRYHTLLQPPGAPTAQVTFETDQFNIYPPPDNGYLYPNTGQPFTVRFVPGAEKNFVILSDDTSSAYVREQRCNYLLGRLSQAALQYKFDTTNLEFNREYAAGIRAYLGSRCGTAFFNESYAQDQQRLARQRARLGDR